MKVNFTGYNLYKSNSFKKGLEFVADNGALFSAGASLALATFARPLSIWLTPKTDKENRKLACAKSIASSLVGFGIMAGVSLPVSNSIKKIDNAPNKYLKPETIRNLSEGSQKLSKSKPYKLATQLFKLGIGAVVAAPKAVITCALIPPVIGFLFRNKKDRTQQISKLENSTKKSNAVSFKGGIKKEPLTKGIGKIIDLPFVQKFSNKYKESNYPMHISAFTDTIATGTFIGQVKSSNKIKEERKNTLIYNSAIATGLSIGLGYVADKLTQKPAQKFIDKFSEANKHSPKLDKYVEGIKIAKPALILGTMYYCVIPFLSTFFAERVENKKDNKQLRT